MELEANEVGVAVTTEAAYKEGRAKLSPSRRSELAETSMVTAPTGAVVTLWAFRVERARSSAAVQRERRGRLIVRWNSMLGMGR